MQENNKYYSFLDDEYILSTVLMATTLRCAHCKLCIEN